MFEEILSRIGERLKKNNIPYMVIGGQAVLLYGEPRLTRDIDITLGIDVDHLDGILSLAKELFLKPIPERPDLFARETMVLPCIDETTAIRVDFLFSFTPYELEAIKRAKRVVISGHDVMFASPEDLIIHKIFAGRPRDIEDVRSVLLRNKNLDINYIQARLKEFDASLDKKGYLGIFEAVLKDAGM